MRNVIFSKSRPESFPCLALVKNSNQNGISLFYQQTDSTALYILLKKLLTTIKSLEFALFCKQKERTCYCRISMNYQLSIICSLKFCKHHSTYLGLLFTVLSSYSLQYFSHLKPVQEFTIQRKIFVKIIGKLSLKRGIRDVFQSNFDIRPENPVTRG